MKSEALLEVKNLKTWFYTRRGIVKAVNGVDFTLSRGECLCLVGESGCGKSVTALSLLRLFDSPPGKIVEGEIVYRSIDLVTCSLDKLRQIRGKDIAMVFQNAQSALNPIFTIGDQIIEQINTHLDLSHEQALEKARTLLDKMRIPEVDRALKQYPHQMSGGMKQRAMIAMSLSCDPCILIADEPTTAVDVTIRAQIMNILQELKRGREMSIIFITHDLSLVREIGDRAAVIYGGRVIEIAPVERIMNEPAHPYTRGLISCLPDVSSDATRLPSIEGNTPNPIDMPSGCPFHPRCNSVMDVCRSVLPEITNILDVHAVACHLYSGSGK
ncbi:MAG: ABC transporter ATP-binding protein [Dehalococcoidia bacterium]|nr:ABC transporter ATP-binding protein [Dehalococcoidia bacterium]MDD5494444.1 ABC transporter ATP-binding protein [Dehalococcoidia bacterium]